MISLALIFIALIIFIFQSRKTQFYLFSLTVFFQFTFGDLGPFPQLLVREWLTPVFFIILLNEAIPLNNTRRERKIFDFRGIEFFIFALILLIITVFVSYIRNEILAITYIGEQSTGIKRTYFDIFINILIFFSVILFLKNHFSEFEILKWFKLILVCSISLGFLRILSFLFGFNVPFMGGGFDYGDVSKNFGGLTFRLGGLGDLTIAGISVLFGYLLINKKINILYPISIFLIQFMSGGRTILVGIIFAISIYSTFFMKRIFSYLAVFGAIFLIAIVLFLPEKVIEGQVNRMTAFQAGINKEKTGRIAAYILLYNSFEKDPIFGKGIVDYRKQIYAHNEVLQDFVRSILFAGGHGSYISVLGIFGSVGLLYFILMVFGGIILSYKKIRLYFYENVELAALASFTFLFLLMESVNYVAGGNGTVDIQTLFFVTATIASIRIQENLNK